jgi:hypothetical protein
VPQAVWTWSWKIVSRAGVYCRPAAENSRAHIASASWKTAVRKALSPSDGEAARLVGRVGSGTLGRRPTSAPAMLVAGLLVVAVAVAALVAAVDVLAVVPLEDPHPAAASAAPASTTTAADRAASLLPRSRTT